jgi:hypothetical protein
VNEQGDAVIVAARLAAGHDGRAEAVLDVRYPNGAVRAVSVAQEAMEDAMDAAGIDRLDALVGRSWALLLGTQRFDQSVRRGGT